LLKTDKNFIVPKVTSGHKRTKKRLLFESERKTILEILERVNNNRSKAAEELGITRRALYYKLKKFGIS